MELRTIENPKALSEAIATAAYYEWLHVGKPVGRDQEFWFKAEAHFKKGTGDQRSEAREAGGAQPARSLAKQDNSNSRGNH